MPEDFIKNYLDARKVFFEAYEYWDNMQFISEVFARYMLDPFNLKVKGIKCAYPEITKIRKGDHYIEKGIGYSFEKVVDLLLHLRSCYDDMNNFWKQIPADYRQSVVPPPDKNTLFIDRKEERNSDQTEDEQPNPSPNYTNPNLSGPGIIIEPIDPREIIRPQSDFDEGQEYFSKFSNSTGDALSKMQNKMKSDENDMRKSLLRQEVSNLTGEGKITPNEAIKLNRQIDDSVNSPKSYVDTNRFLNSIRNRPNK